MQKCTDLKDKMQTYEPFIRMAFGTSWNQIVQYLSFSKVHEVARNIFQESGFKNFSKFTIQETMKTVGPRSLLCAVDKCVHYLMLHEYKLNFRLNGLKVDLKTLIDNEQTLQTELEEVKDHRKNNIILLHEFIALAKETVVKAFTHECNLSNQELISKTPIWRQSDHWLGRALLYDLLKKAEYEKKENMFRDIRGLKKMHPAFYKTLELISHIGQEKLIKLSEITDAKSKSLCDQLVQQLQHVTHDIHQRIGVYVTSILRTPTSKFGILNESTTIHYDKYLVMNLLTPTQRKQQHRCPWYLSEFVQLNSTDLAESKYMSRKGILQIILTRNFQRFSEEVQRYVEVDLRQVFNDYFDHIENRIRDLLKTLQTSLDDKYYCKDTAEFENDVKESYDMCAEELQLSIQYKKMLVEYFSSIS